MLEVHLYTRQRIDGGFSSEFPGVCRLVVELIPVLDWDLMLGSQNPLLVGRPALLLDRIAEAAGSELVVGQHEVLVHAGFPKE
jgi:hypothetical protein